MKDALGRLGLFRTMHAMDAVTLQLVFEMSDFITLAVEGAAKARRQRNKYDRYIHERTARS